MISKFVPWLQNAIPRPGALNSQEGYAPGPGGRAPAPFLLQKGTENAKRNFSQYVPTKYQPN